MDTRTERPTMERREDRKPTPGMWGELLVESSWRPTDRPAAAALGWLITHGYAEDRRQR